MQVNKNHFFICFLVALFQLVNAQAQVRGITPLHQFLQLNADSTIILEHGSSWISPPKYWILSKKGDTTTAYSYGIDSKNNILMPKAIKNALARINSYSAINKIDVNQFFKPIALSTESYKEIWKTLKKNNPWQLADDKIDGEGCPLSVKDKYEIFDGGTILLYLISKSEIKTLSFYAPDFYEEKCPGRKGRQHILTIDALFSSLFAKSEK